MSEFFRREKLKKIREESKVFEVGPPVQVSYIFGLFGEFPKGISSPEVLKNLPLILSRFRLVATETRGKFINLGSGYWTAILGAEDPTEEDPLMAVSVALKMMKISSRFKKLPPLKIAVVTGPVSQSVLSSSPELRRFFSRERTTGNPLIDRAIKILSSLREPAIYIDSLTYQMVRDFHLCRREIELPSSPSPLEVYKVLSSSQNPQFAREPKLIDRKIEFQRMRELFSQIEVGKGPKFITVTGELGIGKSRFVREFIKEVEKKSYLFRNPRERRRIDRWRRVPYSYFGEILRAYFKLDEKNPKTIEEFFSRLKEIIPSDEVRSLLQDHLEALSQLFLLDFGSISVGSISPEGEDLKEREKRIFAAFNKFLELAASSKPVVFILEDLYSADAPSIRLLQYLIRHLEVEKSLFVCVSRSELLSLLEKESGLELPQSDTIYLKPLDRDSSKELIRELLPGDLTLPDKLCEQILDLSEGNPFFLRELLRHLAEKGVFEQLKRGEQISRLDIPQNIEGILLSRLSNLTESERDILYKAAIFGKNFWRGAVESLFRHESELPQGWQLTDGSFSSRDDDLESTLETLVHKGIIQRIEPSEFPGEIQYSFSPGFLQELIYQEVPEALRKPYHFLAAQWLELAAHRNRRELNLEVVHHLDSAGQNSTAAPYHIDIGIKYFRTFDITNAIHHLEQGLLHLDPENIVKFSSGLKVLAESYIVNAQYDKAIETFQRLLKLSWKMGQRTFGGDIYLRIGWAYFLKREFKNALSSMKNGLTLHRQAQNRRGIAMALSNMGQVYTVLGDFNRAEPLLKEALEIRRQLQLPDDLAWALNNMANLLMHKGELDQALQLHREALEIRKKLNNPFSIIRSRNNIALIYMLKGDYDSALAELLPSSALAKKLGEKLGMAIIMVNIAELYLLKGEFSQAEEAIRQALHYSQKLRDPLLLSECYRLQSELALERQDEESALNSLLESFKLVNTHDIKSNLIPLFRVLGDLFASAEERELSLPKPNSLPFDDRFFADPIACYEESISLAHQSGNRPEEAKSRMMLGIYEVNRGNIPRGRYQLQLAQNAFSTLGMFRELDEVSAMIEEIDLFQDRTDRSKDKALRPPRSKLASVDKTIIQQFSYSPEEASLISLNKDSSESSFSFPPPPLPQGVESPPIEKFPPGEEGSKTRETLPVPKPLHSDISEASAGGKPLEKQIPSPLLPPADTAVRESAESSHEAGEKKRPHTLELSSFQFSIGNTSSSPAHTLSQTPAVGDTVSAVADKESEESSQREVLSPTVSVRGQSNLGDLQGANSYSLPLASSDDEETPTAVSTYVITTAEEFEKGGMKESFRDDSTLDISKRDLIYFDGEETVDLMKDEIFLETIDVLEVEDTDPSKRLEVDTEVVSGREGVINSDGTVSPEPADHGDRTAGSSVSASGRESIQSFKRGAEGGGKVTLPPNKAKVPFPPPFPGLSMSPKLPPMPSIEAEKTVRNGTVKDSEEIGGGDERTAKEKMKRSRRDKFDK